MPKFEIADTKYIPEIVDMLSKFFATTAFKDLPFDIDKVTKLAKHFIDDPYSLVLIDVQNKKVQGLLVATSSEYLMNNCRYATELVWWVEEDYRGKGDAKLWLETYEYWANEMGCKQVCLQNLNNEGLDKLYIKQGYRCLEHSYVKNL